MSGRAVGLSPSTFLHARRVRTTTVTKPRMISVITCARVYPVRTIACINAQSIGAVKDGVQLVTGLRWRSLCRRASVTERPTSTKGS